MPKNGRQVLTIEHQAYEGLTRRRSISFVDEKYFVIVDEVSGPATGRLTLRNGLGPGTVKEVAGRAGEYIYQDGEARLRIKVSGPEGSTVSIDKDWYSESMHQKNQRPVIRLDVNRPAGAGVQRFETIINIDIQ